MSHLSEHKHNNSASHLTQRLALKMFSLSIYRGILFSDYSTAILIEIRGVCINTYRHKAMLLYMEDTVFPEYFVILLFRIKIRGKRRTVTPPPPRKQAFVLLCSRI